MWNFMAGAWPVEELDEDLAYANGTEADESLTNLHIVSNEDCNTTEEPPPLLPPRPSSHPDSLHNDYALEDSALDGALHRPPSKDISLQGFMCDDCETTGPDRFHCDICRFTYCQRCWDKALSHRREPVKGQVRHEKTDLELARKIEASIRPDRSSKEDSDLHMDDRAAIWFGFSRTDAGPRFIDNERYEVLLSDYSPSQRVELHPSLVSFIGQTGAGKSSLINLLITLSKGTSKPYDKPVVGTLQRGNQPTSGDVHLYQDPESATTSNPILYADCEGLRGGNTDPLSKVISNELTPNVSVGQRNQLMPRSASNIETFKKYVSRKLRKILWLKEDDSPHGRQFIVENLYSRILYAFSDVVVFVLKESRTVESVVLQLLEWGSKAVENSSNQACLPHAIIVLNYVPPNSLADNDWNIRNSTDWLFHGMDRDINNNALFTEYVRKCRARTHGSPTTQQVLQCYYTTVRVVRIPELADGARRTNLIDHQVTKLYKQTTVNSEAVRKAKASRRMLLNADQFNPYLQLAFDHFSSERGLETPFDFAEASFRFAPVTTDFASNIVTVGRYLLKRSGAPDFTLSRVLPELGQLVASCIMFDTARKRRRGNAEVMLPKFADAYKNALGTLLDEHWPCKVPGCINFKAGHAAGHLSIKGLIDNGYYEALDDVTMRDYAPGFEATILEYFKQYLHEIREGRPQGPGKVLSESLEARNLHQKNVYDFYLRNGSLGAFVTFRDNRACLVCLMGMASHALKCGHVICTDCAKSFGKTTIPTVTKLVECPLQCKWKGDKLVTIKPALAGIRVLSIDGGGVRGITQLVMLQRLERELGGKIPIQSFFDLTVGTSVGGLIGLGLFSCGWRTNECITRFKMLCSKAFTPRTVVGVDLWQLTDFLQYITYRFQTEPLEMALKEAYTSNSYLFGGRASCSAPGSFDTKVAVTAASSDGGTSLFGNYNREALKSSEYVFHREAVPDEGIRIWEAARATSAAPTWFEEYRHPYLRRTFMDGALYHNNPVKITMAEKALMWPSSPLDVNLSIGTGLTPDFKFQEGEKEKASAEREKSKWFDRFPIRQMYRLSIIAVDHIQSSLDSERTWDTFYKTLTPSERQKCFRLNTKLDCPLPELHEVDKIPDLEATTEAYWEHGEQVQLMQSLARRLIASSFYFDMIDKRELEDGSLLVSGNILCRFNSLSPYQEVKYLGEHLQMLQGGDPRNKIHFRIQEYGMPQMAYLPLTKSALEDMVNKEHFSLREQCMELRLSVASSRLEILMCFGDDMKDWYPISGFPRSLREEKLPWERGSDNTPSED